MTSIASPVPLVATVGIVGSAWASGAIASISICAIPPIQECGAPRAAKLQAWHRSYERGRALMPAFAASAAAAHGWAAWAGAGAGVEWRGAAAAAALTVGIVPFTLVAIMPAIRRLEGIMEAEAALEERRKRGALEEREEAQVDELTQSLLTKWGNLNLVRALLPLAGVGFAVWNLFA